MGRERRWQGLIAFGILINFRERYGVCFFALLHSVGLVLTIVEECGFIDFRFGVTDRNVCKI